MMSGRIARSCVLIIAATATLFAGAMEPIKKERQQPKVSFGRDILPILSDRCFKCHGPDANTRMAGLRLDTAEGAFASRDGKWAIVPGKPADSLLVERIRSHDTPMPPISSGKTLSSEEKDLLERWISEGAQYGKLWSFEPLPKSVPVPAVSSSWAEQPLDRFVLAELTRRKMSHVPPASKDRWLRRVTLDLTGLPPSELEIENFQKDTSSGAREKVVDRLLSSEHFGERIAVDWLDAARYSDSYGYQSDLLMPTWPYRDWVVRAFNRNQPYDEFLRDQIAGDLLPRPTRDQVLATAFNRLHRQSNEGGSIAAEFKTEYAVDRVSTFGTAVLGLTLGCARCHDHKFDPITQREFYQLYAYFNSINEFGLLLSTEIVPTPSLLLPTPEQEKKLSEAKKVCEDAEKNLAKIKVKRNGKFESWLKSVSQSEAIPDLLASFSFNSERDRVFGSSVDGKVSAVALGKLELTDGHAGKALAFDGENGVAINGLPTLERWDAFSWAFWIRDPGQKAPVVLLHRTGGTDVGYCGFDLMLEDGHLMARVMRHWPGNALAIQAVDRLPSNSWQHVAWTWDGSGHASGLALFVNGKKVKSTIVADSLWKSVAAYGDLGPSGGQWSFAQRFRDAGFKGGAIDDVSYAARALSESEVARLHDPGSHVQPTTEEYLSGYDVEVRAVAAQVRQAQKNLTDIENQIAEISVMKEAAQVEPAYLLARGAYDAPKNDQTRVQRGIPVSLPVLKFKGANNRLALAQWVTSPNHPLTARVAVNRFWQMLFGSGLVETTENFGVQGSQPSHPDLLDYLARRFVDSKWDVKGLIKSIVLSATYGQDSARHNGSEDDPQNKFLGRGPANRLPAEMIRDSVLAAAGLLNAKVGGPPVNPYQPDGIWQENNTMSPPFVQSKGADLYRRSLYSTWKRTTPVPSMMMFDATSREACTVKRPPTNTPLQALVLLNDVQFVEAARVLAESVVRAEGPDTNRVESLFIKLAGRKPDLAESQILLDVLNDQRREFNGTPEEASKLMKVGESVHDSKLDPIETAAWTVVAQAVINSDAFVWKR